MAMDAGVLENLRDAGCDDGMIERYREIAAIRRTSAPSPACLRTSPRWMAAMT